jgi:hypothetical protein
MSLPTFDPIPSKVNDKSLNDSLLFDSVAIHFNINVFFWQLFIHLGWPFSLLFVENAHAQVFFNVGILPVWFNHVGPLTVILMLLSYYMMANYATKSEFERFEGSIWYPLLFYFLHRCTVAIKYASLSESEYARYMDSKTENVASNYASQLQLYPWGIQRHSEVSNFLLVASALRVGAHIDRLSIVIDDPFRSDGALMGHASWKEYTTKYFHEASSDIMRQQPNGDYAINAADLCHVLLRHSDETFHLNAYARWFCRVLALIMTGIPFFGFMDLYNADMWTSLYLIFAAAINYQFFDTIVLFLLVGIVDSLRTEHNMQMLKSFIRLSNLDFELEIKVFGMSMGGDSDRFIQQGGDVKKVMSIIKAKKTRSNLRHRKHGVPETHTEPVADALPRNQHGESILRHGTVLESDVSQSAPGEFPWWYDDEDIREVTQALSLAGDGGRGAEEEDSSRESDNGSGEGREEIAPRRRASTVTGGASGVFAGLPVISLRHDQNVNTWCWLQLILLNFGDRFKARLTIFTYLCFVTNFVLMFVAFVIIFSQQGSTERINAFASPIFRQAFASVTIFSVYLVACTYLAANVNWERDQQL